MEKLYIDGKGWYRDLVEVTDEDIHSGKKKDHFSCPIAIAMMRTFKGWDRIRVCKKVAYFCESIPSEPDMEFAYRIKLSKKVQIFISRFDKGLKVRPFKAVI